MAWTIDEFENAGWYEFKDFCDEYSEYPSDVELEYLCDAEYVAERVKDMANNCRWEEITDYLYNLEWNGDNGEIFEDGDRVRELNNDDLAECKYEVLNSLHEQGIFLDGEESDEDDEDEEDDGNDVIETEHGFSHHFPGCNKRGLYGTIQADPEYAILPETHDFTEGDFAKLLGGGEVF